MSLSTANPSYNLEIPSEVGNRQPIQKPCKFLASEVGHRQPL
jgi:hypothetical protein